MGASASDERVDVEALTLQQQRTQFVLIQQIQEARMLARNDNGAGAALALNSLGFSTLPPVNQPVLFHSQVLRNPAHIRGKTITLEPGQKGEDMILRFSFDSHAPCVVTVYRSAVLVASLRGGWEVESAAWSSPPTPFPAGLGQSHTLDWESLLQSQAVSATFESDGKHCPLLIELRVDKAPDAATPSVEWTICQLLTARSRSLGKTRVEVVSQQLCDGNQTLELLEMFGSETTSDGHSRQDCIVCQSEPRDTAVLPCRHMCLCSRCSDYIRTRTQHNSYKCPICREKIGRMMRMEPIEETTAASSSEEKFREAMEAATVTVAA
jgi:hypothetical protein